ncbi:unnamed protein product [Protopolystoma xenopodis]|uniref:Uncharacterized protein n=1 Tax=Protopolystoma xenopodis TaxID=117903 RepID=A0A3S5FDT5_9PLAT|nr:unnamed protein product [Protopolystoma xenopodis]
MFSFSRRPSTEAIHTRLEIELQLDMVTSRRSTKTAILRTGGPSLGQIPSKVQVIVPKLSSPPSARQLISSHPFHLFATILSGQSDASPRTGRHVAQLQDAPECTNCSGSWWACGDGAAIKCCQKQGTVTSDTPKLVSVHNNSRGFVGPTRMPFDPVHRRPLSVCLSKVCSEMAKQQAVRLIIFISHR